MILTRSNEYLAVLDACVLIPMALCDTLLRLAEEPVVYRPLWSELILKEVGECLITKIGLTPQQRDHRLREMRRAFPDALVSAAPELIESLKKIPDPNGRHVVATAIAGRAHAIITQNVKHFPESVLNNYDVLCKTPDEFLVDQLTSRYDQVLKKLDAQATAIRTPRFELLQTLKKMTPKFAHMVEAKSAEI
jgi:predicted nucleic acid-binding protein